MIMEEQKDYTYIGLELLDTNLDCLVGTDVSYVSMLCYHINREGLLPFMQFLMYNNFGLPFLGGSFQELDLPMLEVRDPLEIENNAKEKIKYFLSTIDCKVNNIDDIVVKGAYNNLNRYYLFIDISNISITPIFLKRTTPIWFALASEIINTRNVCNIPISNKVYELFRSDFKIFTLVNPENTRCITSPDAVYSGSHFKQTQFQSIFGVSKKPNEDYYCLLYSINDAFKNAGWSSTRMPEYKFNKMITNNDSGRYISGGINRIALLTKCSICMNQEDTNTNTKTKDSTYNFDKHDLIHTVINEECVALIKDVNQQVSLSYHRLDKANMGEQWDPINLYSIE